MRIEQIQAFLLVAELGSFQKAALECGVTQSTISRQIQALETELGNQLFHRSNQAKLTVAGNLLFRRARKMVQEWENAIQELSELRQGKQSELCIAAIHSVCVSALPLLLPRFSEKYPQVRLRVTALGSDRALKVLRDGLVDLAIIMKNRTLVTNNELVVETLYEESISLLTAANHPLIKEKNLTWEHLAAYPQVVFKEGYRMRQLIEDEFNQRDLLLSIAMELNTPEAFCGVVRESQIIAMLPQSLLGDAAGDPGLAIRDLDLNSPKLSRQVAIVTTIDRLSIPPIADFFNLVVSKLSQETKKPSF